MTTYPIGSIGEGIKLCLENSKDLLQSSKLLCESGNKKHAFVLFTLSLEEFGKAVLLRDIQDIHHGKVNHKRYSVEENIILSNLRKQKNNKGEEMPEELGRFDKDSFRDCLTFKDHMLKMQTALDEKPSNELSMMYIENCRWINFTTKDSRFDLLYVRYYKGRWRIEPEVTSNFMSLIPRIQALERILNEKG